MKEPALKQYVRDTRTQKIHLNTPKTLVPSTSTRPVEVIGRGDRIGVLVADVVNGVISIGWSFAKTKLDTYDNDTGVSIASIRMKSTVAYIATIPYPVKKLLPEFIDRCLRYFKTKKDENVTPNMIKINGWTLYFTNKELSENVAANNIVVNLTARIKFAQQEKNNDAYGPEVSFPAMDDCLVDQ